VLEIALGALRRTASNRIIRSTNQKAAGSSPAELWRTSYDWREWEAKLNEFPLEERMLENGLAGYDEYERNVRYRLVPHIW
jgi:hypothetical protein